MNRTPPRTDARPHLALLAALLAVAACQARREPAQAQAAATPAPAPAAGAAAAPAAHAGEGHACPATEGADDRVIERRDPATGATVLAAGAPLAAGTPVALADLQARPEAFAGKIVRIEGTVTTMCTHKRGWFAVADAGGEPLRIVTGPAFLVPAGPVGKRARAEGVVEVSVLDAATARHYAADHQVGTANAQAEQPVRTIMLRASGAEFM